LTAKTGPLQNGDFSVTNKTFISPLLALLLLVLTGCSTADVRDLKNAASDSATLAAIVNGTQPTKNAQPAATAKPAKKPTSSATKSVAPTPTKGKRIPNTPGDFDFYVMSLSWSPDYCAGSNVNDAQQCSIGKKLGFVLHGLWPQYNRGYPADCSNVPLPKDVQQKFPNLFPSSKLYTHEWDKHGTCSGLKPQDYLALAKTVKESIVIPTAYRSPAKAFRTTIDQLKADFVSANPTVSADALAVQCSGSGRYLQELRACFSREGQPIACSQEVQNDAAKSCGKADFLVRNVR
jgi:ribonuclease T2